MRAEGRFFLLAALLVGLALLGVWRSLPREPEPSTPPWSPPPLWPELNASELARIGEACQIWGAPPEQCGYALAPADVALEVLAPVGYRVPEEGPGGLRLLGAAVLCARSQEEALRALEVARDHEDVMHTIYFEYTVGGRPVSAHVSASPLRGGPDAVVQVYRGSMHPEQGYDGTIRGCPYEVIRRFTGEVGCGYSGEVADLLPAVAQVQVGDLVYTVRAYLPDDVLVEFLDLLVPKEGCTIEVFRPEVLEVPGEPIKPDEIPRIMGEGVRLPAYLPQGLTLRGALVESLGGRERKTILIVYADHPCRFYNVPAPWLPDAPNLTIWVDRLPEGHATFPASVREIALGNVTVYVWPEVPLNPTRVEFWVGDLFYSVQGYYPLDEILRVAESIIGGG